MGQPLPLRPDYDAAKLRAVARCSNDAARLSSVMLQIARDWVMQLGSDRTVVLAARHGVEMRARLTEVLRRKRRRNLAEVLACADADGSKNDRNSE